MDELETRVNLVCTQENLDAEIIFQNREEFLALCRYVDSIKPHNFLEIGCLGPSFNVLSNLCSGVKVAVDLVDNSARIDCTHYFVVGDSSQVFDRVKAICDEFDFIFIDADHTYQGVSRDFHTYRHLLSHRGIMAFHDIDPDHIFKENDGGQAYKFWQDLNFGHKTNIVCTGTSHNVAFKGHHTHFGGIGIWRP